VNSCVCVAFGGVGTFSGLTARSVPFVYRLSQVQRPHAVLVTPGNINPFNPSDSGDGENGPSQKLKTGKLYIERFDLSGKHRFSYRTRRRRLPRWEMQKRTCAMA
jgi:hypothetical protein